MKQIPIVSVIVPVYNSEKYLKRCLDSILNQTFSDFELILVNDCSTDNSWALMQEYAKRDSRIRLINLPENIRQGGARNRGIKIARGKYICFIDSDDWVHLQTLEKIVNLALKYDVDFCGYNYVRVEEPRLIKQDTNLDPTEAIGNLETDGAQDRALGRFITFNGDLNQEDKEWLFLNTAGVANNLFSREIIEKNQIYFPENLAYEDNYFVRLYCLYVKRYIYLPEPLYYYYKNPESTTQLKDPPYLLDRLKVEEMKILTYTERNLFKAYYDAIAIDFLRLYYLNSIGLFYRKSSTNPTKKIKKMTKRLHEMFPEITKNPYFRNYLRSADRVKYWIARFFPSGLFIIYKLF